MEEFGKLHTCLFSGHFSSCSLLLNEEGLLNHKPTFSYTRIKQTYPFSSVAKHYLLFRAVVVSYSHYKLIAG
jgi:hypothetical protein